MKIPKPSDEDKAYFVSIVPEAGGVETKAMFGNLAAFVNGNTFMACSARTWACAWQTTTATSWRRSRTPAPSGPPTVR